MNVTTGYGGSGRLRAHVHQLHGLLLPLLVRPAGVALAGALARTGRWPRPPAGVARRAGVSGLALLALLAVMAVLPLVTAAQEFECPTGEQLEYARGRMQTILESGYRIGVILGVALCSLMVLYGGIVVMTARGSPQRMEGGKTAIMNALIGVMIVVLAGVISQVVISQLLPGAQPSCIVVPGGDAG